MTETLPLKEYPRLRLDGEIGDYPYSGALTPVRGRHYLLLSQSFLSKISAQLGDYVECRFEIADQTAVDVPDALRAALAADPNMQDAWDALTAGKQRGLSYMVSSAKQAATQEKRVARVFGVLRGELDQYGKPIAQTKAVK